MLCREAPDTLERLSNRLLYSKEYQLLYVVLTMMSFWALLMLLWNRRYYLLLYISIFRTTPGLVFLEIVINFAMIFEVGVRYSALRNRFWASWGNIADLGIVAVCVFSLCALPRTSSFQVDFELSLDALLLVFRNTGQLLRLVAVLHRSRISTAPRDIRFDGIIDLNKV